jgi:hypothetical protein
MTKTMVAALTLALLATAASAQQHTFYDSAGKVVGQDSRGRVISRETTNGNTTTVYDAGGRCSGAMAVQDFGATRRCCIKRGSSTFIFRASPPTVPSPPRMQGSVARKQLFGAF